MRWMAYVTVFMSEPNGSHMKSNGSTSSNIGSSCVQTCSAAPNW